MLYESVRDGLRVGGRCIEGYSCRYQRIKRLLAFGSQACFEAR
jgi:hypothetical protein